MGKEERKYRVTYKNGKKDESVSIAADAPNKAIRALFPKAGQITLKPAETIIYDFEADLMDGTVISGQVKLARRGIDD